MVQPIENIRNPKNRVSDYFISDVNGVQPIENINGLKNQPVKNGAQVIENKVQSNFGLNENINGLVYKRKGEVNSPPYLYDDK